MKYFVATFVSLFLGLSSAALAGTSHTGGETPIVVTVTGAKPSEDGRNTLLDIKVENPLSVAVVMRDIGERFKPYKLQQRAKVFGLETWRDLKLLSISPNSTWEMGDDRFQIVAPFRYKKNKEVTFEVSFGPKGHAQMTYVLP